jgi:hypothetical protein
MMTYRRLGDIRTILVDKPPMDPAIAMPLLARDVPIGRQSPVDHSALAYAGARSAGGPGESNA